MNWHQLSLMQSSDTVNHQTDKDVLENRLDYCGSPRLESICVCVTTGPVSQGSADRSVRSELQKHNPMNSVEKKKSLCKVVQFLVYMRFSYHAINIECWNKPRRLMQLVKSVTLACLSDSLLSKYLTKALTKAYIGFHLKPHSHSITHLYLYHCHRSTLYCWIISSGKTVYVFLPANYQCAQCLWK